MHDVLAQLETLADVSRCAEATQRQQPQRITECAARASAVALCAELAQANLSCRAVAQRLHLAPRTLCHWRQQLAGGALCALPRGRPCRELSRDERLHILNVIHQQGPHLGLPSLQDLLPEAPRCQLIDLQQRYRQWYRQRPRRNVAVLQWREPGTVWAIDHSQPPRPIDGIHQAILSVRDLASGLQLAWLPVLDQTAEVTIEQLAAIFDYYGAPLVLKSDNGSAFKSEDFARLLENRRVLHLRSPARTPGYNGACEAGIGAMKIRTFAAASRQHRTDDWTRDDLNVALHQANHIHRRQDDPHRSAQGRFDDRIAITAHQREQLAVVVDNCRGQLLAQSQPPPSTPTEHQRLQRKAIESALVDLALLSLSRRSIRLPIKSKMLAKIT